MDYAASRLAEFVYALRLADLPDAVVGATRRHLLDTFGVAIRGRANPTGTASLSALNGVDGAAGRIAVWGSDRTLPAGYAALANGIASHVLDFDDTHTDAIVHGSAIIAPVVMALGQQRNASGEDIITAFVAGWEVAARVGLAAAGSFHERGYHTTSVAGVFGATVAAARILHLSSGQIAHAMGLAGSQASGINEYLANSSSAKSLHTGWSAHAGILAAAMAQAGMTGPISVFEGRDGLLRTHGDLEQAKIAALDSDLGSRWETTRISIKPYPCCHFAHAFIDCVGALARNGFAASTITSLECVVPELELALICEPYAAKLSPATPYAAKFSLPFLLASKMIDGEISHRSFEPSNLTRPELLRLAALVKYRVAKPDETLFPKTFPGWVEATLVDGRRVVERLDINTGHPDNPLSNGQVEAKFRDNGIDTLGEAGVDSVASLVSALPMTSAAELGAALTVGRTSFSQPKRKTS